MPACNMFSSAAERLEIPWELLGVKFEVSEIPVVGMILIPKWNTQGWKWILITRNKIILQIIVESMITVHNPMDALQIVFFCAIGL